MTYDARLMLEQRITKLRKQCDGYIKKMVSMNHDLMAVLVSLDEVEESLAELDKEKDATGKRKDST